VATWHPWPWPLPCRSSQLARLFFAGPERVLGAQGKAVHVGTIEARHIDRRHDGPGQHALERLLERYFFRRQRREIQRDAESALRFIPVNHVQELILLHRR
jgi:hypothetical protein